MILLFYCLWFLAVVRVLLTPLFRYVGKGVFFLLAVLGIWLIIGALTYQARYNQYQIQVQAFEQKKKSFEQNESELESLLQSHPTSRDILLRLATISSRAGENTKVLDYVQQLRLVDPNNVQVKTFIQKLQ